MSGAAVPAEDLPPNLVPASDLPGATTAPAALAADRGPTPGNVASSFASGFPPLAMMKGSKLLDREAYRAGGAVTDLAAPYMSPETAAKLGFGTNIALQAAPAILGGEAAKAAGPAMQDLGRGLMNSALKPSKAEHATGKAAQAVDTMLETGTNVTRGGVEKLGAEIDRLNDAIKQALARSNATVDKTKVAQTLDQLRDRFMQQVNPQPDLATIQQALTNFLEHPLLAQISDIPVQLAQQLKQGTYRALGSKSYGELKGAETEAQKGLARGLKEQVATAVPGVSDLNAAESKLINARDIAQNRVYMDANKNPLGLGWLVDSPAAVVGWLADRSPLVKSLLARAAYSGSEAIPANLGRGVGALTGIASGRPERGPVPQALSNPNVARQIGVPPYSGGR